MYGPSNADMTVFEKFCKNLFSVNEKTLKKKILFAVDFNNNILDYQSNQKVQHLFSNKFQYNMVLTINKPTHVTRNTATIIDHIVTNTAAFNTGLK